MSKRARLRTELPVVVLAGLAFALVQWWPMIAASPKLPAIDGLFFFHQIEVGKAAVHQYGELPLWNPFDCVGMPLWDHPEALTASPLTLLMTPLSTFATLVVWNVLHAAVGFVGMWLLARCDVGLGKAGALVAALMWTAGAWHVTQSAGSHETFVTFYLAPLALHFWREAEASWDAAVGAGLTLAWMVWDGGTYALPFTTVVLGLEALTRMTSVARARRVLAIGVVIGAIAALSSAARLLPLADQFAQHQRVFPPDTDHMLRWGTLKATFLYRDKDPLGQGWPGQQYGFDEYVAYVGVVGLLLSGVGAIVSAIERRWTLFVAGAVAVLALGNFAPWAPWSLLQRHVFPFTSMRVPSRFVLMLALFMCLWIALAVERAPWYVRRALGRPLAAISVVALALGLFAVGDTLTCGMDIVRARFLNDPPAQVVERSPRFYYDATRTAFDVDVINDPRRNHAYTGCRGISFAFHGRAPIWTGDVPQVRAKDGAATVRAVHRTHNTFAFDVRATRPARLLVNSAYDLGWNTDTGSLAEERDLLVLDVPAGSHHVHLWYWPRTLTLGLLLSALGVLGSIAFLCRARIGLRVASRRWTSRPSAPSSKSTKSET